MYLLLALSFVSLSNVVSFHSHRISAVRGNLMFPRLSFLSARELSSITDTEDSSKVPVIAPDILKQFHGKIEEMVTSMALSTSAYYMSEFHDDVTKKWMLDFNNYQSEKFTRRGWKDYLERMICLDKQNVTVYMDPPDGFLGRKGVSRNPDSFIKLQYQHSIDPRKIAHQILTIREDVSGELIADLSTMKGENEEVERFASEWMLRGKNAAETNRHLTRSSDHEECTPLRNRNYHQCAVYITSIALDITRENLQKKSPLGAAFLDKVIAKLEEENSEREPMDRVLYAQRMPTYILEELYHHGITQGVEVTSAGESMNAIRIAQDIMSLRVTLSTSAGRVLADLATNSRAYYKMIKDLGGFNKFDVGGRPKFTLVDMRKIDEAEAKIKEELLSKKIAEDAIATNAAMTKKEPVEEILERMPAVMRPENRAEKEKEVVLAMASPSDDKVDDNIMDTKPEDFGAGPMMM